MGKLQAFSGGLVRPIPSGRMGSIITLLDSLGGVLCMPTGLLEK